VPLAAVVIAELIFVPVPDTVILPVELLYTATPMFAVTAPPEILTAPVESLRIALPFALELVFSTVPPVISSRRFVLSSAGAAK